MIVVKTIIEAVPVQYFVKNCGLITLYYIASFWKLFDATLDRGMKRGVACSYILPHSLRLQRMLTGPICL